MGQVSFQGHKLIMFSHAPRDLALLSTAEWRGGGGGSVYVGEREERESGWIRGEREGEIEGERGREGRERRKYGKALGGPSFDLCGIPLV